MRVIILIIYAFAHLYTMPFDKIYIYNLYNQDEKNNKKNIIKSSIERTFDISDDSFAFIEGIISTEADYKDASNEKTINNHLLRELYYDKYFLSDLINLKIGRSIKTFDFTNTYSVVDFLSSSSNIGDADDRTLNKKSLDGISLTLIDITSKNISQYIAIHTYVDDMTDEKQIDNQKYLFEMTQSGDKKYQSIFIYNNNKSYPAIAIARSETIGDKVNYNTTLRYDFMNDGKFSSVSGVEYNPNDALLIGLEGINLGNNIAGRFQRIEKHKEFRSGDDFINYYKDLTSQNYISLYIQYSYDNTDMTFSWLENVNDGSKRFSTQLNHKFDTIEANLQINNFQGQENTEFGYIQEQKAYEVNFFISYLLID